MQKRGVAQVIIYSLLSCGIYAWYWFYKTAEDSEKEVGPGKFTPAILLVVCLCLGPIGFALAGIQFNESMNKLREKKGKDQVDQQVIFIVLGILCGVGLVGMAQAEINKIIEE